MCLKDGTVCFINDLVIFSPMCARQIAAFCPCAKECCVLVEVLAKSSRSVCKDSKINVHSTFIHEVRNTRTVPAIWPDMIKKKRVVVVVETVNNLYVTPVLNQYERN